MFHTHHAYAALWGMLVALATCIAAIALTICPKAAFAQDVQIETISERSCATQNSLLILDDPTYAKNTLGLDITQPVTASAGNVSTSRVSKYIGNCWSRGFDRQYAWTASELNAHLISYIGADLGAADSNGIKTSSYINTGSAFSIEPNRTWSEGDSWSATFTYPVVGLYEGRAVGARMSMSGQYGRATNPLYDPETGAKGAGSDTATARFDFAYPMVQLPDLLYAGGYFFNAYNVTITIEFFDAETSAAVTMLNDDTHSSYLSFNSQNYYPYNTATGELSTNGSYDSWTEDLWIPKSNTTRIEKIAGGNMTIVDRSNYYAAIPKSNSFTDRLGGQTYNYNRTTFYQNGDFQFLLPRYNSKVSGWFSLDSSSVGTSRPKDPEKTVSRTYPTLGDTVTWNIDQQVHKLGETIGTYYQEFVFSDTLPAELDYKSAKMYCIIDGTTTDITSSAGTLTVNGKKVTYTFSSSYLASMKLKGETYRFAIETTVNGLAANDQDVSNTATVQINDWSINASASTHPSWISVTKAWVDDGDKTRPDIIAISATGEQGTSYRATAALNATSGWKTTVSVPRYNEDGTLAHYTVSEVVPEGYEQAVTGDALNGYTITNNLIYTGTAEVSAKKTLDGNEPGSGHAFLFELRDTDTDTAIQKTTSNEKGDIVFSPLNYTIDDLGEHHYSISEINEGLENMKYDDHVETFTVYVTKGLYGKLDTEIKYDDDGALFENVTIKPVMMPLAGENGLITIIGCGLAVITLGVGAGYLLARRRKGAAASRPQWRPFDD